MANVRFGMVGGGMDSFIGDMHRAAAAIDGSIDLVCGAFSADPAKSVSLGQSFGLPSARVYRNYLDMFEQEAQLPESERMEFVAIVTPNHLHFPIAQAAINAGIHVLCEKPATNRLHETLALEKQIEHKKALFALVHPYIAYPLARHARDYIGDGHIGPITKVVVEYSQGWLSEQHTQTPSKLADSRLDPGQGSISCCIADIGVHAFNLAEYITGLEVESVLADLGSVVKGRSLDDDGSMMLRFSPALAGNQGSKAPVRGLMLASQISIGEENNLNIRIYGVKGAVAWCLNDPQHIRLMGESGVWLTLSSENPSLSPSALAIAREKEGRMEGHIDGCSERDKSGHTEAFANIYQSFAQAVREARTGPATMDENLASIKSGVRGMSFIEAAVESHKQGNKWVSLAGVSKDGI